MSFGAEGIGLCRTEHMFFEGDRIKAIREMIVSKTAEEREGRSGQDSARCSRATSRRCIEALEGRPMTIRFLDPPLHEFLPTEGRGYRRAGRRDEDLDVDELKAVIDSLHEFNPMMGHRGCRLAVTYPEIAEMQTTRCYQRCYRR